MNLEINNAAIESKDTIKYLGMLLDSNMKFTSHINAITSTISRNLGMMCRVRPFVEDRQLLCLYNALILPYFNYCCLIWGTGYFSTIKKLVTLQKRAMRIIGYIYPPESANPIFKKYNILKVQDIAKMQIMLVMHKYICNNIPTTLRTLFQLNVENRHGTRQNDHFKRIFSTKNYRLCTIACLGPKLWNSIISPNFNLNEVPYSKERIKKMIKDHFISQY